MQPVVLLQQERKRSGEKERKGWRDRKVKGGGKRGRGEERERHLFLVSLAFSMSSFASWMLCWRSLQATSVNVGRKE